MCISTAMSSLDWPVNGLKPNVRPFLAQSPFPLLALPATYPHLLSASSTTIHPRARPIQHAHPPHRPHLFPPPDIAKMKYRSPSPMSVDGALPTPPRSLRTSEHSRAVTNLLDHLQSFYQQEQYWVHHTRAALEMALAKGVDADALMCASPSDEQTLPSPASSTSTLCDSPPLKTVMVKPDPDAENTNLLLLTPEEEQNTHTSRWLRRKNRMRLRLEGINSHPHRNNGTKTRRSRPLQASSSEPGARLLEMFSELVDARMESCQRISRMVQESASRQQQLLMC